MPLPDDFIHEALYDPTAWFIDDIVEIDAESDRMVGRLDTTKLHAFVDAQRPFSGHDKHLPGAVAIQMTGTMGNLHAVYVLGLRATEGWVGYGTHIHSAKFPNIGKIGPPVLAIMTVTRKRKFRGTWFLKYEFKYEQEDKVIFESEQTAAWYQGDHRGPLR